MSIQKNVHVLLYGLGAIGSFYAFILTRSPTVRLTVVARSNFQAVKENGLVINSENHGDHTVRPHQVAKKPSDVAGHYDYVVCAVKALNQEEVAHQLRPVIGEDTTLVIIQNGVGNEDAFREAYPNCSIITCVTWVGATQISPGVVKHMKSENTQIGLYPNASLDPKREKDRLNVFIGLLKAGETPMDVEDDMQAKRWEKVVWNVAWNSLTTLTMVDTHTWLKSSEDAMPLTRRVMKEVIDIARADKVNMKYELIDELINKILKLPGIGSSMQTDCKAGRQMEVGIILGTPVKKAKELGIDAPVLQTLHALLVAVNQRMAQRV